MKLWMIAYLVTEPQENETEKNTAGEITNEYFQMKLWTNSFNSQYSHQCSSYSMNVFDYAQTRVECSSQGRN